MDDIQSWWEVPSIAHFCSLFRAAFNLLDFDIEELEEALLTDGAEDNGSSLLQELIVRLLCGCLGNNDISTFNYQMFLRRLFRQKCQEYKRDNPFNTDMDFQFLPLRTKVEILHALCDFRLDGDDVQDLLKNLESDSLRVEPLGYDENDSAYWYFYGTRLYREDFPKIKKKTKEKRHKGKDEKKHKKRSKSPENDFEERIPSGWQVVCFTEDDWDRITKSFKESQSKVERELYQTLSEDFLPEIPRLFAEKERLQRKRLLEYQPRRQSSRLEKLKQQKEEEERTLQKEEKERARQKQEQEKKEKLRQSRIVKDRANRALIRSISRTNSECGSTESPTESSAEKPPPTFVGRQTNNSLSSATGQIVIQGLRRKLRSSQVFRQTEEDLQTGMYKILDFIKNHEDAWPFLEPVDEEYAPRYYSIISKPMDLQRMEDKLDEGEYLSFTDFKSDFQLIVDNCRKYNGTDNEYTEMVGNLQESFRLAVDRYLESEPSSDEEVAVEYPQKAQGKPPALPRQRSICRKKRVSTPAPVQEKAPRSPSVSVSLPSPDSSDTADRMNENDKETEVKSEPVPEGADTDGSSSRDEADAKRFRSHNGTRRRKRTGVIKNAAAIEALELATEQTLKDINKWLDDTPRFSEFSSASNSPSHFISAEEYDVVGSRIESEYRQSLKMERPPRSKDSKDISKRKLNKDPSKQRRREVQRTIERLQPGKSKGNLISNIQNSGKMSEEGPPGKPKDIRNSLIQSDETTPKLSLGTVLGTDVLGFGVGQSNHNFDDEVKEEMKPVSVIDEVSKPPLETSAESPEPQLEIVHADDSSDKREKEEVEVKPIAKDGKQEKVMPNLSAWFKAFGAPKSSPAAKKKNESVQDGSSSESVAEERNVSGICSIDLSARPSRSNIRPISVKDTNTHKVTQAPLESKPSEESGNLSPVLKHGPDVGLSSLQQPAQHQVAPRQRKVSTGSSMSERSSFSQDMMDTADGSSPRLSVDDRLGSYPAPYPSPLHRSPVAASPVMASPRPEESPKFASYPPLNGTIPVGFYQDTSSTLQKSSPEKSSSSSSPRDQVSTSPFPTYTPRMYPPHDPGGFYSYQNQAAGPPASTSDSTYDHPAYGVNSMVQFYDTSKPLTDQYRAARTQSSDVFIGTNATKTRICSSTTVTSSSQQDIDSNSTRTSTIQKSSAAMFPVKKRLYSEMESGCDPHVANRYHQTSLTPPPAHCQAPSRIRIVHSPERIHVIERAHHAVSPPEALLSGRKPSINAIDSDAISKDMTRRLSHQTSKSVHQGLSLKKSSRDYSMESSDAGPSRLSPMNVPQIAEKVNYPHITSPTPPDMVVRKSSHIFKAHSAGGSIALKRASVLTSEDLSLSGNEQLSSSRMGVPVIRATRTRSDDTLQHDPASHSVLHHTSGKIRHSSASASSKGRNSTVTTTACSRVEHMHQSEGLPSTSTLSMRSGDMNFHRGPFSPVPPSSLGMEPLALRGNISNLPHVVDRYPSGERLLPGLSSGSQFYGEKGLSSSHHAFRQNPSISSCSSTAASTVTSASSAATLMSHSSPATMAYSHDSQSVPSPIAYNRSMSELTGLPSKVSNIQSTYNRSGILPKSTSYNRPVSELPSALANKVSSLSPQASYSRTVGEIPSVSPLVMQHSVTDLSPFLNKMAVPPTISVPSSYSRPATDYTLLPAKSSDTQTVTKPSKKRKSKQQAVSSSEMPAGSSGSGSTAFQQYVGLESSTSAAEPSAISLKSTSVVPGSAFNFGPAHSGLGLFSEKDYSEYLEEYRTASSSYYMSAQDPNRDKVNQSTHPSTAAQSSLPFLSHPRPPFPLSQAFMNHQSGLVDPASAASPLYQQYLQRHQEELLRASGNPMVLHQGLLAPPPGYPAGYHPALSIRQPYDSLNRPTWL